MISDLSWDSLHLLGCILCPALCWARECFVFLLPRRDWDGQRLWESRSTVGISSWLGDNNSFPSYELHLKLEFTKVFYIVHYRQSVPVSANGEFSCFRENYTDHFTSHLWKRCSPECVHACARVCV